MAASFQDLIQITDFQTYLGQQILNVYYYRIVAVGGIADAGYDAMLEWFEDTVVSAVQDVQSGSLVHDYLELRNLSNGVDIRTRTLGTTGTGGGTSATATPSFTALTYKLIRESLVTRNGSKRFGGIDEAQIAGNTWVNEGSTADLAIADALAVDYTAGLALVAEPIIVQRPITVPAGSSYAYSSIGSAQFTRVGTQNTRKPGKGD